ncbi:Outer membrane protein W precursor [hydrothermal vent metagenome]|uniref:Outer membrane protein W n=1 Tax=hydrothermal vent metagenome TaxID=652676 RepID=A0A3B0W9P8_9ZZZZ
MKEQKLLMAVTALSTLLVSSPLMAIEKGDILINARILSISPNVDTNQVIAGGAPLAEPAGIDVDDANSLGVDITYMMTDNFGLALMLDTSSKHDITGTGNLSGVDIGEVNVLPPSVIAVWHFMPKNNIRPYVGAGVNYTIFFDASTTNEFTSTMDTVLGGGVTSTDVSVDNAIGILVQAGLDIDINKDWYVSFDAKYIDMDTTARIKVNGAKAAKVDFDVNPLVLGVGIGTKF